MSSLKTRLATPLLALVTLAVLAAPAAEAQDVELTVVRIKASGQPTGSPQIDPKLDTLPGIAALCARFARCDHDGTSQKKVAWDSTTTLGGKDSRIEVTVEAPKDSEGERVFSLELVAFRGDKACSKSKSAAGTRPIATAHCGAKGGGASVIHHVSAHAL